GCGRHFSECLAGERDRHRAEFLQGRIIPDWPGRELCPYSAGLYVVVWDRLSGRSGRGTKDGRRPSPVGNQWLKVQLVGERGRAGQFERGVSQHPTINDAVHIVTEEDLREIYGPGDPVD